MQKQEEKKNRGPKPTTNHQQRLENIVRQTTVEARVRRHNHACIWVGEGGWGGLRSNRIQMFQKNSVLCVFCERSQSAAALQRPSETRWKALNPLEGRKEDSAKPLGHSSKWSELGNEANGKLVSAG